MSGFTYAAGSATPTDPAGLVEWPTGIRFSSDGKFRALYLPPLWSSAPLVVAKAPLPGDGATIPDPKLDSWDFDIVGWLIVDDTAPANEDVKSGFDYLLSKVNVGIGWQDVEFGSLAWGAVRRQMRLRVTGEVTAELLDKGELMSPERIVTIPVTAADPRQYSVAETTTRLNGNLTNDGNYLTPMTVVFTATSTWKNPVIDGPGPAGSNRIKLNRTLTTGQTVTVTTYDPDSGQLVAVDNTGANAYGDLAAATARGVNPGTEAWTVSQDSGTGTADATIRSAWA